jgi:hypothetical protein
MPKAFLFSAAATIAFFVTVEIPVSPQPDIHTDFEPAALCANRGAVDASKHCDS